MTGPSLGVARAAHKPAELAFTYQNDMMAKRVVPLAESLGSTITMPCDVGENVLLALSQASANIGTA